MVLVFSSNTHEKCVISIDGKEYLMSKSQAIQLTTCGPLFKIAAHKLCFPMTTQKDS
jgi:hypothetical protein